MNQGLNHFDSNGKAIIVDVSDKDESKRIARCQGKIYMNEEAFKAIQEGTVSKGDVLGVARVAGIMGVKRCPDLIPMCHPLMVHKVSVDFELNAEEKSVLAICEVGTTGKTGVEMEALCGVNIALMTIYDMCKAIDRGMVIGEVCLHEKSGGKSGHYAREMERK